MHVVLGAGAVGCLVGGALAHAGEHVVLVTRAASLDAYPGTVRVESAVLGDIAVEIAATTTLAAPLGAADVVWVTVKAPGLAEATALLPPATVGDALVVPLLNGIDHVAALRARYRRVAAAVIRVEAERLAPGVARQASAFAAVEIAEPPGGGDGAGAADAVAALARAGLAAAVAPDEATLLWRKLVILAPLALATSAHAAPVGAIRDRTDYLGCRDEAVAVARAEGADIDADALRAFVAGAAAAMRTSLQRDLEAGRGPELDAIAGPILRGGRAHGIATPCTAALAARVAELAAAAGPPAAPPAP